MESKNETVDENLKAKKDKLKLKVKKAMKQPNYSNDHGDRIIY